MKLVVTWRQDPDKGYVPSSYVVIANDGTETLLENITSYTHTVTRPKPWDVVDEAVELTALWKVENVMLDSDV